MPNFDSNLIIDVPVVEQMPPRGGPVNAGRVNFLLTKLLRHKAGMLHADFTNDQGRWRLRGWGHGIIAPEEVVATIEQKSVFRGILARFGAHYLAGQLYGGFREVLLSQNGKLHFVAIYMANDSWRGYWLRAYTRAYE